MPVSFIQKYLVKKLDLTNEAEVSSWHLPSNITMNNWAVVGFVLEIIFFLKVILCISTTIILCAFIGLLLKSLYCAHFEMNIFHPQRIW